MEHWIEHVDEPDRLILAWQAHAGQSDRRRWAVGELARAPEGATFRYFKDEEFSALNEGRPANELVAAGFLGYPTFQRQSNDAGVYTKDVLEAFMRRLPPSARSDFPRYLEYFRLRTRERLSPFALLGATEARLPSDGFSLVDPLRAESTARELIFEVAGHRHHLEGRSGLVAGQRLDLVPEPHNTHDRHAVRIEASGVLIGYVNRLQSPTVDYWLAHRAVSAWLLRLNGTSDAPRAFVFVKVRPLHARKAA